jgi:hypothetical protein
MGANMMLTIGSILIFGLFLSTSNKMMTGNSQIAAQNEYYVAGLSLAQSVIDEAKSKAFDEKTIDSIRTTPAAMTAVGSLGKEGGEAVPATDTLSSLAPYSAANKGYMSAVRFDDVDDYNRYTRLVNTPRAEGYRLSVSINYASDTCPDSAKNIRTFCKRITVKVTSPYFREIGQAGGKAIPDTLNISYAFTY